jgi:hypothetical protein
MRFSVAARERERIETSGREFSMTMVVVAQQVPLERADRAKPGKRVELSGNAAYGLRLEARESHA